MDLRKEIENRLCNIKMECQPEYVRDENYGGYFILNEVVVEPLVEIIIEEILTPYIKKFFIPKEKAPDYCEVDLVEIRNITINAMNKERKRNTNIDGHNYSEVCSCGNCHMSNLIAQALSEGKIVKRREEKL